MKVTSARTALFGPYVLDLRSGELRKFGTKLKLGEQPFQILLILLEHPGDTVTREQLRARLWANDTFVDFDHGLNSAVQRLRVCLSDSAETPRWIETLPRRGYRFVGQVQWSGEGPSSEIPSKPGGEGQDEGFDDPSPAPAAVVPGLPNSVVAQVRSVEPAIEKGSSWRSKLRAWCMVGAGLALLTLGVGLAWWLRPSSLREVKARRVVSNSADAPVNGALVSPDGKYVAYSDPTGVYIRQVDGGETRPLTLPTRFNAIPTSWFPDSTHLLLTNHGGPQGTARIWKLSILGGEPQMLLDDAEQGIASPDGTRIAFFRGGNNERALWLMESSSENPHLFFKQEPDPSGVTQTDTWAASWSPDGERIAYIQRKSVPSTYPSGDRFFVFTRKVDGSDAKLVVQDSRMDYFTSSELQPVLCWAPNGRLYFALRSQAQGDTSEHSVWSIAVNQKSGRPEGEARELLSGLGWIGGFSAATAVSRLVFWRSDIQVQAFVSDLDPNTGAMGSPRRLTLDQSLSNVPSAWTADSKAVVYTSRHDGKDWIYRQKIDETTPVLLVQMRKHGVLFPRLSGEGSEILYGETDHPDDPNAPVELMAAPIAGGTPRLIMKEPGINNIECAQSPSRLCILNIFLGQSNLFYLFDLRHGKSRLVVKLSSFADWGLSPDGSMLVLHTSATEGRLRFVSMQSGSVREVVLKEWPMLKGVDWSADSKMVLIGSVTQNNVPVVLGVNIEGNARVLLKGDRRIPVNWVIPSPDGKYGALGVTTGESSVWMVENY